MYKIATMFVATLFAAGTAFAQDDGIFDRDLFNTNLGEAGIFDGWDNDGNEIIDNTEFDAGSKNWGGDEQLSFNDWDLNDDNGIDENEFGDSSWNLLDDNRDGELAENEWGDWEEDGLF